MVARTERAWLCDLSCERRTGNRTKPSIRPCGSGRRRGGLASHPSDRGGIPPVGIAGADRARSRCPSAFTALAACEHRPSTRSQKRSANRLRTRCGALYNRYGDKCQLISRDRQAPPPANSPPLAAVPYTENGNVQAVDFILDHVWRDGGKFAQAILDRSPAVGKIAQTIARFQKPAGQAAGGSWAKLA